MYESELNEALRHLWNRNSTENWILARLGRGTPGDYEIDVPGKTGYVYVMMGANGDQGISMARDKAGASKRGFQLVRMRMELGELIIREASEYAGGGPGGGGTLESLSDVVFTGLTSGQTIQYDGINWVNVTPPGGGGGAPSPHDHESSHHTPGSKLNWGTLNFTGSSLSNIAARDHSQLNNIAPDQHHPQVHLLVGPDHTADGLSVGWVVRATAINAFAWGQLLHDELGGITANQHHAQQHNITGPDHTIIGSAFDLVGATATNVLGLLTPTHNPGAAARILKTDAAGSLILDTTLFVADAPNNWVGINRVPAGAALDIIAAANADHTQRIKQKSGQTGRMWRIEDTAGNELIVLDSVGNLQSGRPGFVSGLTGWQVTPQGNAEFNNIWARGELHATVFVKDEVHASGGTMLVASAGKLHSDAVINAAATDLSEFEVDSNATAFPGVGELPLTIETTSPTFSGTTMYTEGVGNEIEIDDPPSGPGIYFQPGEIIRVKTEIDQANPVSGLRLSDLWLEVMAGHQESSYSRYSVVKRSGSDSTIPAGAAVVSYGQRGDGRILLTSDWRADEGYSPYIDVFNTGENPWTGNAGDIIPRMRMGQLKGVGVPGVSGISQWGLIAGSDLTDANSGYLIASNLGMRLYKVPLMFNNGVTDTGLWSPDGNIRIGKNVASDATTGFRVITKSSVPEEEGNVVIGNEATGNFLRWNQFTGVLTVAGSLLVTDPGGTVTKTYVDDQDSIFDNKAKTYGTDAFTNSQTFVNDRRLIKVTGTWNSAAANIIRWGTTAPDSGSGGAAVQLHFANGAAPRSVFDGNTTAMSVRTFLYVDLATAGTLTLLRRTTEVVNSPNLVLIAVCDPGTPKASVTVVGGSTYISGGNIFTQSILTNSIAANAIYAGQIVAAQIGVGHLAADTITLFGTVQSDAEEHGDARRVIGISGTWGLGAVNTNVITWTSGLSVRFGNGSSRAVAAGSITLSATITYLAVDLSLGTLVLAGYNAITSFTANHVLIAVARAAVNTASGGAGLPTLEVVAGATFISGDGILADTIAARNIAANAVTADKINVNGNVAIATGGSITGGGKTFQSAGAGFFLGQSAGLYRFDVGDSVNYLRWSGSALTFRSETPLILSAEASNQVLNFSKNGVSSTGILTFNVAATAELAYNFDFRAQNLISANAIFALGNTVRIATQFPATTSNVAGVPGDIRWGFFSGNYYLYICVEPNNWRRVLLNTY